MARKRKEGGGQSTMGYFKGIFQENPEFLKTRSNAEVLQRYLADHPDVKEVSASVRNALANVKSIMRRKLRVRGRRRRRAAEASAGGNRATARTPRPKNLEMLEIHIDDCMALAKNLDRDGLDEVIKLLRRARNQVVWKSGQ